MDWGTKRVRALKNGILCAIGLLWVAGIGVGLRTSLNYEDGPATPGSAPTRWPASSKLPRSSGVPTVVVMAHPHCPCTRATIGELSLLMTRLHNRVTAVVVFVRPKGMPEEWGRTDLWRDAQQIPGVTVVNDPEGKEATLFGALASGETMLYDAAGVLRFSGGITASRGHSGDNVGRSAIASLVSSGKSDRNSTPVFGCYLGNPETREKEKQR